MANSPYDQPRYGSRVSSLDHLCVWRRCNRSADPAVPVEVSLCREHWWAVGQAFNDDPLPATDRRAVGNLALLPRSQTSCPRCRSNVIVTMDTQTVRCSSQGCKYQNDLDQHSQALTEAREATQAKARAAFVESEQRRRAGARHNPVVYYLRFGDRIKIGTTTNLTQRLLGLPHDEVMAIEDGSYNIEARRHAQFADSRLVGEWFKQTPELMALIKWLAQVRPVDDIPKPVRSEAA